VHCKQKPERQWVFGNLYRPFDSGEVERLAHGGGKIGSSSFAPVVEEEDARRLAGHGVMDGDAAYHTSASGNDVKVDFRYNASVTTGSTFTISGNAYANGTLGDKYQVAGTTNAPVPVAKSCACEPADILPIASWVDARATTNDNAVAGVDQKALNAVPTQTRIDLPCGSYYFEQITNANALTTVTKGRTATTSAAMSRSARR
jgi:hypothetical protein